MPAVIKSSLPARVNIKFLTLDMPSLTSATRVSIATMSHGNSYLPENWHERLHNPPQLVEISQKLAHSTTNRSINKEKTFIEDIFQDMSPSFRDFDIYATNLLSLYCHIIDHGDS